MATGKLPPSLADRMVELLFTDVHTLRFNRILYPACRGSELVDAVFRYCRENSYTPPKGLVLTVDSTITTELQERYGDRELEVVEGDFLSEEIEKEIEGIGPFDYVLSDPPQVPWKELDEERRREYAAWLTLVSPDDPSVDPDGLYIERSLQFLRPDGRGIFLTSKSFKRSEVAAPLRGDIAPLVNDIVEPAPEIQSAFDTPQMIAVLTGRGAGEYTPDDRVNRPDPEIVESQLAATAHETASEDLAEAIMTPLEAMDVYDDTWDVASVYFDMFSKEYDGSLVFEDRDRREVLHGYVSRAELKIDRNGSIAAHTRPIPEDRCLPPTAGIETVVSRLGRHRFCFVGEPDDPQGIVTRYDLNKHPLYHQFYDMFARFEIGLRQFIRTTEPDWESDSTVTIGVHGSPELVPDRLATAQLSDLVEIVQELDHTPDLVPNGSDYEASLDDLVDLRNDIAHYNPIVHVMSSRPTDDEPERGAPQLAEEYGLLSGCVTNLESGD